MDDVAIVVGVAAHRIRERVPALQRRHGVRLELIHNDRAQEWNNAYSLWLARDAVAEGALLVNGDTVHPPVRRSGTTPTRRGGGPTRPARGGASCTGAPAIPPPPRRG